MKDITHRRHPNRSRSTSASAMASSRKVIMLQQSAEVDLPSGQGAVPTGLTVGEPVGQRVAKMKVGRVRATG